MSTGCVCGHVVEYHDYQPAEDEYGNRVDGPGAVTCYGNLARLVEPRTCPCQGYERKTP